MNFVEEVKKKFVINERKNMIKYLKDLTNLHSYKNMVGLVGVTLIIGTCAPSDHIIFVLLAFLLIVGLLVTANKKINKKFPCTMK